MTTPTIILGASGYVGGELLRLVHAHPRLELAAAASGAQAGEPIGDTFGHLASVLGDARFVARDAVFEAVPSAATVAVFCAAPHGEAAAAIARLLEDARGRNLDLRIVDASADFRYPCQADWERVYGLTHGAPQLLDDFHCAVPEHGQAPAGKHIGHPGCFATAALLAAVPLLSAGVVDDALFFSGITGSTGSGKQPQAGTHHPLRNSNLYAYKPLAHRHAPEVAALAEAASGRAAKVQFVPHSGPFARGIHMTLQARASRPIDTADLRAIFRDAYAEAPFVRIVDGTPRLKDVVASNYCHIGVAADGHSIAVFSVIDNLVKGAAGGAVQWMNRLLGFAETDGLTSCAPGWT